MMNTTTTDQPEVCAVCGERIGADDETITLSVFDRVDVIHADHDLVID